MDDQLRPVDINTASLDELARIPGVGPTIAARIQSQRPFQSVDELTNVSGIGDIALEKIRSYFIPARGENGQDHPADEEEPEPSSETQFQADDVIALPAPEEVDLLESGKSAAEEEQAQNEMDAEPAGMLEEPEIGVIEDEIAAVTEPTRAQQTEQSAGPTVIIPKSEPANKKQPRYATRADAFWISFGSSFLAFVVAISLTLGVLALLNNGLRYVSPAQLSSVSRQVDGLSSQASILEQDLGLLRTRVDNLEGLSGRVSTVEQSTQELRGDLDAAAGQVEQLNQSVSGLQTEITELKSVSDRFQSFLDGLRELLNNEQQ